MTRMYIDLLWWLSQGYAHCRSGAENWCQDYLNNARDVIIFQQEYIERLKSVPIPRDAEEAEGMQSIGFGWLAQNAPERLTDVARENIRLTRERDEARATWFLPDAKRREIWISDRLKTVGHINRADICTAFDVSVPQASADLKAYAENHAGEVHYNASTKRYECRRAAQKGGAE